MVVSKWQQTPLLVATKVLSVGAVDVGVNSAASSLKKSIIHIHMHGPWYII